MHADSPLWSWAQYQTLYANLQTHPPAMGKSVSEPFCRWRHAFSGQHACKAEVIHRLSILKLCHGWSVWNWCTGGQPGHVTCSFTVVSLGGSTHWNMSRSLGESPLMPTICAPNSSNWFWCSLNWAASTVQPDVPAWAQEDYSHTVSLCQWVCALAQWYTYMQTARLWSEPETY